MGYTTNILLVVRDKYYGCLESYVIALKDGILKGGTSNTLNKRYDYEIQVSKKEIQKHKALVEQLSNNCFNNKAG